MKDETRIEATSEDVMAWRTVNGKDAGGGDTTKPDWILGH